MNKTELIDALSEETTFSKRDVSRVLEAFARIVTRALKKNDKVQWSGFGCFTVSKRAARNGRNPVTKQPMKIEGTVVPKFKAGKNLKEAIRGALK